MLRLQRLVGGYARMLAVASTQTAPPLFHTSSECVLWCAMVAIH